MDRAVRPLVRSVRDDILPLIEARQAGALKVLFLNLHPADIADLISSLSQPEDQSFVFGLVDDAQKASDVLVELPPAIREPFLEDLSHDQLSDLVEEMESDDAADVLQEMPPELAARVMLEMKPADVAAMKPLLVYPEDSAGGLMATEILTVDEDASVGDARDAVRARRHDDSRYFYVYVVDPRGRLMGTLSLRDLVLETSRTPVGRVMNREPVEVGPLVDQEEVAHTFRRYDLVAVPVVDERGVLLGRITVDDVVDVMREEAEEDLARIAGTQEGEFDESSVRRIVWLRLPWIMISLVGGLVAGSVLRHFTGTLGVVALFLVVFVPVITAMGGNAGSQAAITMVRRLALRELDFRDMVEVVFRESRVGLLLGLTCGIIVGTVAMLWRGEWFAGVVVGVAMATAILVAATMGALVPLAFHRLRVDPAIATGPFVSMSNDVIGLLIYFGFATFLLQWMGASVR